MSVNNYVSIDDYKSLCDIIKENMDEFIESLEDDREKTVIIMRYGLYNTIPHTQKEVAAKLNISRSYVSRIEKRLLVKMKKMLEE